MKFWRTLQDALGGLGGDTDSEFPSDLCDELRGLLDLACYAAAQAVAFARELERQMNHLGTDAEHHEIVIREYQTVQVQVVTFRTTIEHLHRLLKSARVIQVRNSLRSERDESNRALEELLSAEELREIEESLRKLESNTAGGEP